MSELFKKVPAGYRELQGEEKEKFITVGTAITLLQFKLRQHEAELDAARARVEIAQHRIKEAQREMQIAYAQRDQQNEALKIGVGKEDVVVDDTRVFVIERPAGWELPKKQKPEESQMRLLPDAGRVEVTKLQGTPPQQA